MKKILMVVLLSLVLASCSDVKITVLEVAYTIDNNYRVVYRTSNYAFGFENYSYVHYDTFLTKDGVNSFILHADDNVSTWGIEE